TFSGGSNFSSGYYSYSTTYDNLGSLYAGGVPLGGSFSTPQWPTTPGAFQTTYNVGATNITCINKYNPLGSALMYSTYFGGTGSNDLPHPMIINGDTDLIVAVIAVAFNILFIPGGFESPRINREV